MNLQTFELRGLEQQQNSLWPMGLGVAASREGLGVVWQRSADIVTQL